MKTISMRHIKTIALSIVKGDDTLDSISTAEYWASEAIPNVIVRGIQDESSIMAFMGVVTLDKIPADLILEALVRLEEEYSVRHIIQGHVAMFLVSLEIQILPQSLQKDTQEYFMPISQYFTSCHATLTTALKGAKTRLLTVEELATQIR